jgi:catechol 2,3-dioxygenase-like lactoylglutathione lyase family enzyme
VHVPELEVTAVDHLYVTVSDFSRSVEFYDRVMRLLGFRKGTLPIAGDPHAHYFNRVTQLSIRPARSAASHDPYAPGFHHLCLRVADRAAVDRACDGLRAIGVEATEPRLYPEYAEDYYATFFEDPDGLRLELVALRRMREQIRDRWHELVEFENPFAKLPD